MEKPGETLVVEKVKKIGFCRGNFSLIHGGHCEYLRQAKSLVDELIVMIDSDQLVLEQKGRLILNATERRDILLSIKYVDQVFIFTSAEVAMDVIKSYTGLSCFDIFYFKGGDYRPMDLPEYKELSNLGVTVCCLGHTGQSTTDIIKRIKESS